MNCNEATKLINAALDGELNAAEKQAVDRHLEKCPECRHIASHSTRLKSELQTPVAVPSQLKAAVRDHLFQPTSQPVIGRNKPMNKLSTTKWGLTGLAAALAIATVVALTPRPADAKAVLKKMQTAAQKSPVINVVEKNEVSGRSFKYEVRLVKGRPSEVRLVEGQPIVALGSEITVNDGTKRIVKITDEKGNVIPTNAKANDPIIVKGFKIDVTKLDQPTAEGIAEALQIGGKGAAEPKLLGTEKVGGKEVQILCVEDKKNNQRALYWINSATGLPLNQRVEVKVDGKWTELKNRKFSYIEVQGFPIDPVKK